MAAKGQTPWLKLSLNHRYLVTGSGKLSFGVTPVGRKFAVRVGKEKRGKVRAWCFYPREGKAARIGEFDRPETREFTPPNPGEMIDWVLVLDDAARNFPVPGQGKMEQP